MLVLLLLGLGVGLLLALLATAEQGEGAVERGVRGDAKKSEEGLVVARGERAAGKGEALEVGGEAWRLSVGRVFSRG